MERTRSQPKYQNLKTKVWNLWFHNININNSVRPPETFHSTVTAWLDFTEHRLFFSFLQMCLVAVIERLLLIRNQCKTTPPRPPPSRPDRPTAAPRFSLTGLTLALCGCISLRGGGNPYSCHICSRVGWAAVFSPLQRAGMHETPHHLRQPRWPYFYVNWSPAENHISPTSRQTGVCTAGSLLFEVRIRFAVKRRCHGIGGRVSLSAFCTQLLFIRSSGSLRIFYVFAHHGLPPGRKIWY